MSHICYICNKSYANKASLATHKSRYHIAYDNNSNESEKTRKRYRSNEDLSEQSDDENEVSLKKLKAEESNNEIIPKLVRAVSGLITDMEQVSKTFDKVEKGMKQIPITFSKIAKDMDEVEDKIYENKRNITREKMIKQMTGSGINMEMKRFYGKIVEKSKSYRRY